MSSSSTSRRALPKVALGGHWVKSTQPAPTAEQTAFSFDAAQRVSADQLELRSLFAAMVRVAGGADWLAEALNQKPAYANRIAEAINGVEDRKIQLEWLAPLFGDHKAVALMLGALSERCGYEPPVRQKRQFSKEQKGDAALEVINELKDEELLELLKKRMAHKLGGRPEDL